MRPHSRLSLFAPLTLVLLTACGGGGSISPAPTPAPIISAFAASTSSISILGQSTLSWTATNATSLKLDPGAIDVTGKSSLAVAPLTTTSYTLTATNAGGSVSQQASVTVVPIAVTTSGNMLHPRYQHITVALNDGRVVAGGGYNLQTTLISSEVYDPAAGTFAAGGSFVAPTSHQEGSGVLLPDGRALFVGGEFRANCELFDPATSSFAATGSLHYVQGETIGVNGVALLLANGKVLAAGGRAGGSYVSLAGSETWNPADGTWTQTGNMNTGRVYFTANLLKNGKVLVAGGQDETNYASLGSAELFDPATGTWAATGNLLTARYGHTSANLPDGRVLVFGGGTATGEIYDPANGAFTATPVAPVSFPPYHNAVTLPNGRVLLVGGGSDRKALLVYDPPTNGFVAVPATLSVGRVEAGVVLMKDGRILVAGGYTSQPSSVPAAAEIIK